MNKFFKKLPLLATVFLSSLIFSACTPQFLQNRTSQPTGEIILDEGTTGVEEDTVPVEGAVIEISNFTYYPATLSVKPGTIIAVTNEDSDEHTLTSNQGFFDTGLLAEGETAFITAPTTPGTYDYHCTPHPDMVGTLTVEE